MIGYSVWISTSVTMGFAAAWIARQKGKDPLMWFFIGMLLNVFVLLLVAGVQKKKQGRV